MIKDVAIWEMILLLLDAYLRATIYKKGAVPKIDYFKYEFFPTFFILKAQLKYNSKNKFQTKRSWIDWVIPRQVSNPFEPMRM